MQSLPGFLRIAITLIVAMAVGAAWAGIAALLKVTRGVSEVISTIMLNAIATFLIAYLLTPQMWPCWKATTSARRRSPRAVSCRSSQFEGSTTPLYSLMFLAAMVGVIYALVLSRTVFGFSLKATGMSETAAIASGISVKKMIVVGHAALRRGGRPGRHAGAAERFRRRPTR